jgi:hypothetical protein
MMKIWLRQGMTRRVGGCVPREDTDDGRDFHGLEAWYQEGDDFDHGTLEEVEDSADFPCPEHFDDEILLGDEV